MKKISVIAMLLSCLCLFCACATEGSGISESINSESSIDESVDIGDSSSEDLPSSENGASGGGFLGGFTSISGSEDGDLDMPSLEN